MKKRRTFMFKKNTPKKVVFLFTRQLATLINARLPLLQSLLILAKQEVDSPFKKIILQIIDSIQSGSSLSEALAIHPKVFNNLYINMTKAGEEGGILGIVLQRLADLQEKAQKTKNKISSLLVYPTIVLIITIIIMGFLFAFVVPKFEVTFTEMLPGKGLPLLTQYVITMSRSVRNYIPQIIIVSVSIVIALNFSLKTLRIKKAIDASSLKLPLLGNLVKKSSLALFARTLGTLIDNGVPLLQALRITQETASNSLMSHAISNIYDGIKEGDAIITTMETTPFFPPLVISMIAVGEETGQLAEMLLGIASIYENEVDELTTRLLTMIEPLMILFLALIVGTIVIALFLPLVTMMSEFSIE